MCRIHACLSLSVTRGSRSVSCRYLRETELGLLSLCLTNFWTNPALFASVRDTHVFLIWQ